MGRRGKRKKRLRSIPTAPNKTHTDLTVFHSKDLLERDPDATSLIIQADRQTNCLSCGRCCKKSDSLTVFKTDPNFESFTELVNSHGLFDMTEVFPEAVILNFSDGNCYFFDDSANRCGIYQSRPNVCKMFPFILQCGALRQSDGSNSNLIVLSSMCPSISGLKQKGLKAVNLSDIEIPISVAIKNLELYSPKSIQESFKRTLDQEFFNNPNGTIFLRFLGTSWRNILHAVGHGDAWSRNLDGSYANILFVLDGEPRFPIF